MDGLRGRWPASVCCRMEVVDEVMLVAVEAAAAAAVDELLAGLPWGAEGAEGAEGSGRSCW